MIPSEGAIDYRVLLWYFCMEFGRRTDEWIMEGVIRPDVAPILPKRAILDPDPHAPKTEPLFAGSSPMGALAGLLQQDRGLATLPSLIPLSERQGIEARPVCGDSVISAPGTKPCLKKPLPVGFVSITGSEILQEPENLQKNPEFFSLQNEAERAWCTVAKPNRNDGWPWKKPKPNPLAKKEDSLEEYANSWLAFMEEPPSAWDFKTWKAFRKKNKFPS